MGGYENWRKVLTLPNILKEFNPSLSGFVSSKFAVSYENIARFSVAVSGSITADAFNQTKKLIYKMQNDENVDMKRHWKLVTYMIGANDFCSEICKFDDQEGLIENAGNNLYAVLKLLKENLPRTLVNVVLPPDVSTLLLIKNRPIECKFVNFIECPCFLNKNYAWTLERSQKTIKSWKEHIEMIVGIEEFHDDDVS